MFFSRMRNDELGFAVEEWDRDALHVETVLARAGNLLIARGAYDAAVALRPNARITLRHGIRVIEDSTGKGPRLVRLSRKMKRRTGRTRALGRRRVMRAPESVRRPIFPSKNWERRRSMRYGRVRPRRV